MHALLLHQPPAVLCIFRITAIQSLRERHLRISYLRAKRFVETYSQPAGMVYRLRVSLQGPVYSCVVGATDASIGELAARGVKAVRTTVGTAISGDPGVRSPAPAFSVPFSSQANYYSGRCVMQNGSGTQDCGWRSYRSRIWPESHRANGRFCYLQLCAVRAASLLKQTSGTKHSQIRTSSCTARCVVCQITGRGIPWIFIVRQTVFLLIQTGDNVIRKRQYVTP
jgi:hypothetical protein